MKYPTFRIDGKKIPTNKELFDWDYKLSNFLLKELGGDYLGSKGHIRFENFISQLLKTQREQLISEIEGIVPEWIDNPNGEINSYTTGRRDERKEIRERLKQIINLKEK